MSERHSLSHMPAQEKDPRARDRRKELLALDIGGEEALKALFPDVIGLEGEEQKIESYAVSTFVIEKFWDYLKERIAKEPVTLEAGEEGDTVAKKFVYALNKKLSEHRDEFVDEFYASVDQKSVADLTKEEILVARYFRIKKEEYGMAGFPSMADLPTLIGRMADVIPKVYERDLGRGPTEEELLESLKHPSLKRLFMEIMTNSREVADVFFSQFEGQRFNLNDYDREFDPKFFMLKESEGKTNVILRPEQAERYRIGLTKVAEIRVEEGQVPIRALQCPVLYTGKYVEMHDWVVGEFRKFYTGHSSVLNES